MFAILSPIVVENALNSKPDAIILEQLDSSQILGLPNPRADGRKEIVSEWTVPKPAATYFYQGCNTTFTMSWDDVRPADIHLAPIDEKYGISHTLFAPSHVSYPNHSYWNYAFLIDELFQGYDVQSHSGKHLHLSSYNDTEQEYLVKWGKTGIEELFGFTPVVFAYPYGDAGEISHIIKYFDLGRIIAHGGTSWPPERWHLAGTTIAIGGISDKNINSTVSIMNTIYREPSYQVFKGYGHTNNEGTNYGVTDWVKYESVISRIAGWENVWYTSWGELVAYTIEKDHVVISDLFHGDRKMTFNVSAPALDTSVYKIPLTLSIFTPKNWSLFFPQIDGKHTSRFSIREYPDFWEILLDVVPDQSSQNITIWRDIQEEDQLPPEITNLTLKTETVNQSWDRDDSQLIDYHS